MKKYYTVFIMLVLLTAGNSFAQLTADAGPNIVACVGINGVFDSTCIGGSPSATGGVPPYTYTWEARYTYQGTYLTFTYFASDFLNDTTLANPTVKYPGGQNIVFRLTVTDAMGATSTDSMRVRFSLFMFTLDYYDYTLNAGDSAYFWIGANVSGGLSPQQYLWRPNHGLIDSTSICFWAKPEHFVAYYLTITDSAGCKITGAPFYYVNVIYQGIKQPAGQTELVEIGPNPAKDFIVVKISPELHGEFTLRLFDTDGKLVKETMFTDNESSLSLAGCNAGLYTYTLHKVDGLIGSGKLIVK